MTTTSEALRAVIVYESMFGNTQKIGAAIKEGLDSVLPTELVRVDQAPTEIPADVRLLVVGGPTHAFSMTRWSTRTQAAQQGHVVMPVDTGIREWLQGLRNRTTPTVVATFDTRITKVRRLPGSAARSAAKVLRHRGYKLLTAPASFFVADTTGPIDEGELARARAWGADLAAELRPTISSRRRQSRWSA